MRSLILSVLLTSALTAGAQGFVTITAKAASTLYSGETTTTFDIFHKSDANRDKKINAADIVKLVNDNAPQSDIDAVVKIIMKQ